MAGRRKLVYVGCRANLNRSFILEQILLKLIQEAALPIDIKSGGVMVDERVSNMSFHPAAVIEFVLALQKTGLDFIIPNIRKHQAHAFTLPDLQQADLVLTMTRRQREHLKQHAPAKTRVMTLSQLRDVSREEDVFDAMLEPVVSVEAFVWQIAQIQYYVDIESLKTLLGLA
jgi:protein-tyrosine-phosphatase